MDRVTRTYQKIKSWSLGPRRERGEQKEQKEQEELNKKVVD